MNPVEITPWHWVGFILCVLFFLALDLGVFHRGARTSSNSRKPSPGPRFGLRWPCCSPGPWPIGADAEEAVQFTTGYVIELSLSLDNVLVIALIFAWFRVPPDFQHRLLFWGILGALVMRGVDDRRRRGAHP